MITAQALQGMFSLQGKVAIVTGGTGVLGGAMAQGLAAAGAKVGILGRRADKAAEVATALTQAGGEAMPLPADVLDHDQLAATREAILARWGRIDILINAAGGNTPEATIVGERTFFNMPRSAMDQMLNLNLMGSIIPSQVFGEVMAKQASGAILNISSMASVRTLTRVLGYGAAKTAIDNFTRWLALEMCFKYGAGIRVNAIAPGLFRTPLLLGLPQEAQDSLAAAIPFPKRLGQPQEYARLVLHIIENVMINGEVIRLDGALRMAPR